MVLIVKVGMKVIGCDVGLVCVFLIDLIDVEMVELFVLVLCIVEVEKLVV